MIRNQLFAMVGVIVLVGCGGLRDGLQSNVFEEDSEYVVTLLVDLSGSFEYLMAENGKAYEFALQLVDRYFRDRIGSHDKLIIAQISGTNRALLWQGSPSQLRRDFPNAAAFRRFLLERSHPSSSFVHAAIEQTVQYVMTDPVVANRQAKSAIFVLSDMLDNSPNSEMSKIQALQALRDYAQLGGVVGLYYVDQLLVTEWRKQLANVGLKHFRVDSEVGRPNLPSFE